MEVTTVDLREQREPIKDGTKFKLTVSSDVPRHVELHFPNTELRGERLLQTNKYASLAKLDHDIQKRIAKSKVPDDHVNKKSDKGLLLSIGCNGLTYSIFGVLSVHNYYLYALDTFRTKGELGDVYPVMHSVPALFEFDGRGALLNIVVFHSDPSIRVEPLPLTKLRHIIIPSVPLFTCERISTREPELCAVSTTENKENAFAVPANDFSFDVSINKEDTGENGVQEVVDVLLMKE